MAQKQYMKPQKIEHPTLYVVISATHHKKSKKTAKIINTHLINTKNYININRNSKQINYNKLTEKEIRPGSEESEECQF